MNGIPLIETNDAGLIARAYNLGLKIVPNFAHVLTLEQLEHYEQNLSELKNALTRVLVVPQQLTQSTSIIAEQKVMPVSFKTADTDLDVWLAIAEKFAKTYLGVEVKLWETFVIPETLPWQSAIPIFDPGGMTNSDVIQKVLRGSGLATWEEVPVDQYSGSGANGGPTLRFIQSSVRPDADTMGKSPDWLVATQKNWLDPRGYALAFALHHQVTGEWLDPQTFTWFPNNRLSDGWVARGHWDPVRRLWVRFRWGNSDVEHPSGGARLAIQVPLKS